MSARTTARLRDVATLLLAACTLAALGVASADCDWRARVSPFAPGAPSPATIELIRASGVPFRAVVFAAPNDATGAHAVRYFRSLEAATELVRFESVDALVTPVRAASLDVRDNGTIVLLRMDAAAVERDLLEVGHDDTTGRFAVARLDGDVRASLRRLLAPRPNIVIAGDASAELQELLRRAGMLGNARRDARRRAVTEAESTRDDLVLALSPPPEDDVALAARVRGGAGLLLAGTPGPLLAAALGERGVRFVSVYAAAPNAFVIGAHPAVAELHARLRLVPWNASESFALALDRSVAARASTRLATLLAVRDGAERVHPVAVALDAMSTRASPSGRARRTLVLASVAPLEGVALRTEAGALLLVELLRWLLARDASASEQTAGAPPFAPRRHHVLVASVAAFLGLPGAALAVAWACARRQRRR